MKHGVTIVGYTDFPSRLANQSSQLYSTNLRHLLTDLCPGNNGDLVLNMDDEVIRGTTVIHQGHIIWPPPPILSTKPAPQTEAPATQEESVEKRSLMPELIKQSLPLIIVALVLFAIGAVAPASFMSHFTVFVLACFIGYQVIWNVSASLHTLLRPFCLF